MNNIRGEKRIMLQCLSQNYNVHLDTGLEQHATESPLTCKSNQTEKKTKKGRKT